METLFLEEFKKFSNQSAIWALLNGPNKGKTYLSSDNKSVILIENSPDPYVFIAGEISEKTYQEILVLCPDDSFLYCDHKYHHLFLKAGWKIWLRVQLSYSSPIIKPIQDSYFIRPIDNMDFFKQCSDYKAMSERFGSDENFLQYGIGYALCNDKEIIAEVYSAYLGESEVDISIVTHPDYRRQGAGAQIASYFAEQLIRKNMIPIWSCFPLRNEASLRTALSIGFRVEQYYMLLVKESRG